MPSLYDTLLTRREVLKVGACSLAGYWFLPLVGPTNVQAQAKVQPRDSARFVIFVNLDGGQSHVDAWDLQGAQMDAAGLRNQRDSAGREVAHEPLPQPGEAVGQVLTRALAGGVGQRPPARAVLRAVSASVQPGAAEGTAAGRFRDRIRVRDAAPRRPTRCRVMSPST